VESSPTTEASLTAAFQKTKERHKMVTPNGKTPNGESLNGDTNGDKKKILKKKAVKGPLNGNATRTKHAKPTIKDFLAENEFSIVLCNQGPSIPTWEQQEVGKKLLIRMHPLLFCF